MEDRCPLCEDGVLSPSAQKTHFMLHIHGVINFRGKLRMEYLKSVRDPYDDRLLREWVQIRRVHKEKPLFQPSMMQSVTQFVSMFI